MANKSNSFPPEPPGVDGSEWIIEAHLKDAYWLVDRWSPRSSFRRCGEYLILLSGIDGTNKEQTVETHMSPKGTYKLEMQVGNRYEQKEKINLMMKLMDSKKNELDYRMTGAFGDMKWAVAWCGNETIALLGQTIGTYAWRINNDGLLVEIEPSEEMIELANKAFRLKYGQRPI